MERIRIFLCGVVAALLLAALLGADDVEETGERLAIGRFQAVAAATKGRPYYWIVDTATGEVVATNYLPPRDEDP
jgi:hypothetical protein